MRAPFKRGMQELGWHEGKNIEYRVAAAAGDVGHLDALARELAVQGVDVIVATQFLFWGTSVCSGSDKQTLHTASTSFHGDDFVELGRAIAAGGAMDADTGQDVFAARISLDGEAAIARWRVASGSDRR